MHLSVCLCSLIDDYFALPFTQVRDHRNADGAFKLKCQVIRAPAECFGATKQHLKASLDNPPPSPPPPHSSSNCRQVLQVLSTVICAYKLHLGLQRRRLWRRFVLVCCCCCTSKQRAEWGGGGWIGSNAAAGMLPIRRAVISDD